MDEQLTRTLVHGLLQTLVPTMLFGVVAICYSGWRKFPVSRRTYDRAWALYGGWLVGYGMTFAVWGLPTWNSWYQVFMLAGVQVSSIGKVTLLLRPDVPPPASAPHAANASTTA